MSGLLISKFPQLCKEQSWSPHFSQHIFGILVDVQVWWDGQYYSRPLPKTVFAQVQELVKEHRWNRAAAKLWEPRWEAHSFGSR